MNRRRRSELLETADSHPNVSAQGTSKSVDLFLDRSFDYVIIVCDRARQACPVFPGQHNSLHWGLDDPAEVDGTDAQKLEAFRRTRTEVATRLRPFVELARRARGTAQAAVSTGS